METPNYIHFGELVNSSPPANRVLVSHLHHFSFHFLLVIWPTAHPDPYNTSFWNSVLLYFLINFCHCELFPKATKSPRSWYSFAVRRATLPAAKMPSSLSRTRSHAVCQETNRKQKNLSDQHLSQKKILARGGSTMKEAEKMFWPFQILTEASPPLEHSGFTRISAFLLTFCASLANLMSP